MTTVQVKARARMAMKKREEQIEEEERESGELNLVPYLDIVVNILLFLLASISSGVLFGHINTSLPDHAPASAVTNNDPKKKPDEQALQLVVSVTNNEVLLWSLSQLEGTLEEPKLRIPRNGLDAEQPYDYSRLNAGLVEIVQRRFPNPETREPATKQIILQADPTTRYEIVIGIMDHVRAVVPRAGEEAGSEPPLELFPIVHFSSGFE